jgi:hypothetical protein
MKKQQIKQKKLNLKKFQISKISNPQMILGGNANDNGDDDPIKTKPTIVDEAI